MDIENVLTDSKWIIITELTNGPQSPTQLAKKLGVTNANISTQLRLLEALDLVGQERLTNVERGKPRKLYSLKKNFAYMILATDNNAGKRLIKLDFDKMLLFTIWFLSDKNLPFMLSRFFLENNDLLKDIISIGYLNKTDEKAELMIITQNPEKLHAANNKKISWQGTDCTIHLHIHTKEAVEKGFANKEEYFISTIKKVFILAERENILSRLKRGQNE